MTALTLKAWRRSVMDCAADLEEPIELSGSEVRAIAAVAKRRYDDRLSDSPGDYRINGITSDPTPARAIRNVLNELAAARRTAA